MTPETAIKKEIKQYLSLHQWFQFPILQGLGAYKGICDIISIKNGIVLFIEVKSKNGKLSQNQIEFGHNIKENFGHYIVARCFEDVEKYINGME